MKKILIVDDNEVHLVIAENILKENYEINTAKSGKDAVTLLSKGYVPNLILLDILMPDMDGWETYNKIKGISLLRNVSIAFLTSLDGVREKMYASRIGAADLITKPYNGEELKKRIEKILQGNTD
ncbi:MAG: response regulator [Treponema sp.]|nr:response regulator [Treponema sp.]